MKKPKQTAACFLLGVVLGTLTLFFALTSESTTEARRVSTMENQND